MRFSLFFIDRPIFATVIAILLTLVGSVSYFSLPVTQYPEIAPPTIRVSASYPGASAEVVADTVATPIEQEINGVEGMLYMLSQSTGDGNTNIAVTFKLGTNIEAAEVLVQNRVNSALPRLPSEVRNLGVSVQKASPDLMMVIHMLSPDGSRDQLYISNYAKTQVVDQLARIDGVGRATVFAERAYSMRIWLDPELVAARNLTAGDVIAALRANNVQVASGIIDQPPVPNPAAYELQVQTQGRLTDPEQFANIVVATGKDGGLVRVRDIGHVELGAQDYSVNGYLGDNVALPIGIFQRPGSNALQTADAVLKKMDELSKSFPPGIEYKVVYNPTDYIAQSIDAVYTTIGEAVGLVVLVIVIFLQSLRASLIPIIAIPVSLVGTFAMMSALGFSINNLTLFGLVLCIGIVVDDAIVVVENVERTLREGHGPREAARMTMREVSTALLAAGLVLLAVFIPSAFLSGITGQFFRQFAVTVATATGISVFLSLTLSPAIASLVMRAHHDPERPHGALGWTRYLVSWPLRTGGRFFNAGFDRLAEGYRWLVRRLTRIAVIMLVAYAGLLWLTYHEFNATPTGFIPPQDQGYLITVIQLPAGSSLSRTDKVARRASDLILKNPGVRNTVAIVGLDGATFTNAPNSAAIFVPLKPFAWRQQRGLGAGKIRDELQKTLYQIKDANIFLVEPPPVRGVGTAGGWKMYVQDRRGRGLKALEQAANQMMIQGNQQPQLSRVFTLFNTNTPALYLDIDRVKAELIGVSPDQVAEALEVYIGSTFVNDFNFIGRTYRVTAMADGQFRNRPEDLLKLKTRSKSGKMTPIGAVASIQNITLPWRVAHYNLFPAAAVQGSAAPGVSTGDALNAAAKLAHRVLPAGFGFEWTELALQEKLAGNTAIYVFGLATVFVFLLLAAQYESWMLPLSVILIVPMCLLAAVEGITLRGMDNNILSQIGFVVLVGLASKNAILIVEFARQGQEQGMTPIEAAAHAARLRLRPILMTSFAFILGVLPMAFATGAGAEMRQALGTAVFFGMLGVTFFGLIFTPVFYVACRWLGSKFSRSTGGETPRE